MRVFDLQSANKTLPLVKTIVRDILDTGQELRRLVFSNGVASDTLPEYNSKNALLHKYILELEELGCIYKDYDFAVGLVDFPALIDQKEVFLCWRSDEDRIEFYHGIHEGYAQRKAIPEELLYTAVKDSDSGTETKQALLQNNS